MGVWQYTKVEDTKVYPENTKYDSELKKNWK